MRKLIAAVLTLAALVPAGRAVPCSRRSKDYPNRAIHIVVPFAQILSDPAMREKSERTGAFPIVSTPEQFSRFIRDEADRWSRVLKETNIKYDWFLGIRF